MKKVVVTGASGFIGRHTLSPLAQRGYEVHPLKLDLAAPHTHLTQLEKMRPTALLHLAWETTPGDYWHTPSNIEWLKCSLDLLKVFSLSGGKRVVIAGSCAEISPKTLYGACKESLRLTGEAFLTKHEVSFSWGRIFSPYGPHEKSQRLFPTLIHSLIAQTPFKCTSQEHCRDFLFVEDVAEAFVSLLDSSVEGAVDIGSGESVRIGDLVTHIADRLEGLNLIQFSSSPSSEDNPTALIAQRTRLFEEVGFKPKYTLHKGIDKTIEWYRNEIYS